MPATEKLTKKEMSTQKVVILSVSISVVCLIVAGIALKILVPELLTNQKVLSATLTAKKDINTKKANAITLLNDYHNLGGLSTVALQGMPTYAAFPELLDTVERIAGASGVQLQNMSSGVSAPGSTSQVQTVGSVQSLGFSVDLAGNYNAIVQFINNIQLSLRPIRIDSITMNGSGASLTVSMDMTTYYAGTADISDKTESIK